MSENDLRQSEDYKNTKEKFDGILSKVPISYPRAGATDEYKIYEKNCLEFYETWKEAERISEILRGLKTQVEYPSDVYKSMSKLLVYLGLVESVGVALVDMVLILLVASGKEVHTRGPFVKHIRELDEIKKIRGLRYKLDLLKDEELHLFNTFIDLTLRNLIAHLKLRIQSNGEIKRRDGNPIDIDKAISQFWYGVDIIKLIIEDSGFLKDLETLSRIEGISHE